MRRGKREKNRTQHEPRKEWRRKCKDERVEARERRIEKKDKERGTEKESS